MTAVDARVLNWRFVVPDEPADLVVLDRPVAETYDGVTAALQGAQPPAIVVPDLSAWTASAPPRTVLREVADALSPGGWVCVGFPNRWFPRAGRGAMGVGAATATLRSAGLTSIEVYLPLPDHRHPALLVEAGQRAHLDYVFRHVFLTYLPAGSRWARPGRRLLAGVRRAGVLAPHAVRVRFAPAYLVVARRSGLGSSA